MATTLDDFDGDNLYNQVIGEWDGVTTTLPSWQDVLAPGGRVGAESARKGNRRTSLTFLTFFDLTF